MNNKAIGRTLLALAVSSALGACNTADPAKSTDSLSEPTAVVAPVTITSDRQLEEIAVSGSRVGPAPEAQAPAPTALSEMASTGARIQGHRLSTMTTEVLIHVDPATLNMHRYAMPHTPGSTERYSELTDNGIQRVITAPVSTFSIDVDTAAYSNVRRFLSIGQLPPADAIRAEELINYFDYDYPRAEDGAPFSIATEIAPSPWNSGRHLLHIGIQAADPAADEPLRSNLVFLVDVSGSMASADKLGLLQTSLKLLSRQLTVDDSIAIVVYAGASGVVLQPTPGNETAAIAAALDSLAAGGGTNGAAGIQVAYNLAQQQFIEGGINRVLLATDGDFNVGLTDFDALKKLVSDKRATGISLSTLGFGTGNYNDQLMEQLADAGNGNYAYIDTINEARKVLVDELASTLQTVASDVKIQIEFNPAVVSEYRLVGYENRMLAQEDFNNDKVDAGEIGAGHSVTALYEITLADSDAHALDPLRYAPVASLNSGPEALESELAYLKLRYKEPGADQSRLLERILPVSAILNDIEASSVAYRFAAAVAGFSQVLRDNKALGEFGYDTVLALANDARGDDPFGYRSEFINLVKTAQALDLR